MNDSYNQTMLDSSHICGGSAAYVDALYEQFLKNPDSVSQEWRQYFGNLPQVNGQDADVSHADIRDYFAAQAKLPATQAAPATTGSREAQVQGLINAYRLHGHHHAKLDPLNMAQRKRIPDLELTTHHLSDSDLNATVNLNTPFTRHGSTIKDIYQALQDTYCGSIGFEYMHITDNEQIQWIQEHVEKNFGRGTFNDDQKKKILYDLTAAEGLEKYLGTRYVGQKRFSLEGGDSLIPMLHELIRKAGHVDVKEMVVGMAHRGRLNVLINVLGKAPEELFQEFEGKIESDISGDVKYHMGFSSDIETSEGALHLAMAFNPSHLEIISPVVEGSVRSRQRRRDDLTDYKTVVPLLIHGDAAFAGQGVVMETFNFSQARGYATGGTVHIVINNQIGFTTSNPLDARSTLYCTDVAKMVQAPILHVNGDDPEAVVYAMQIAFDFRMRFKRDVVVDLVCYRRHGHNEADEPSVTQPLMYQVIRNQKTTRELYAEQLVSQNIIDENDAQGMTLTYRDELERGQPLIKTVTNEYRGKYLVDWSPYAGTKWRDSYDTTVPKKELTTLAKTLTKLPKDFTLHPVVKKILDDRDKMTDGDLPINWGYAETLAYATLLKTGHSVRLSGQDCGRGTFAHRHAVLHDYKTGECFVPLQHLGKKQEDFIVIDSVLSEEAVLGFEYGYAQSEPNALVIWEAQFGDFANGAQVVIDQFISSGEQKWGRYCGLVMLLPHGYEGQGPEHSSARLERYLQLCAEHNMQVCVPSTPAQIYHLLRRQVYRPYRKPLIVMSPKSLLRHKLAVSSLDDLANGEFAPLIPEIDNIKADKVKRVVMCSGKIYYELLQHRNDNNIDDIAIVRIEQLYPFPRKELCEELKKYKKAQDIVWCQEEPKNQGAWYTIRHNIEECLQKDQQARYVGRRHFASPAAGFSKMFKERQLELVEEALAK